MDKVRTFKHLGERERIEIEALLQQRLSLSAIAKAVGRSVSTVSREIKRNGPKVYRASAAQYHTELRHRNKPKRIVFDDQMRRFICQQLQEQKWSPEIICAMGKRYRSDFVCTEWVYQWIWKMKFSQAAKDKPYTHLYEFLRHASRRRKRSRKRHMRGNIIDRRWIDQRPLQATVRNEFGHLEADIILGKDRQPGLLVVLDRKSRKTWLRKLKTKHTKYVMNKLSSICAEVGEVKTVTFDNDQSFAEHYRMNKTGIDTFFTHPYSSQEKGSVENRIGIIRMFFPKKTDFTTVTEQQVKKMQQMINQRPLRMFNYKCPNEIFINPDPIKLKT